MYQRLMLVAALVAALGGSAIAQSLAPGSTRGSLAQNTSSVVWNQLVKVYPNNGALGSAVGHYVLTIDVLITENWSDLETALDHGKPDDAKRIAHANMHNPAKPTNDIVDLVLAAAKPGAPLLGTPPYVDIQTIGDYSVEGSTYAPRANEVKKGSNVVVASPNNTLRIHLDVPIANKDLSPLESALSSKNGCDAYHIIQSNIPEANRRSLIDTTLKTALGCTGP